MRNLLAFAAMALLTFMALGWFLDWYQVSSTAASGGHRQVKIDLNNPKIGEDLEKAGKKVRQFLEKKAPKDKEKKGDKENKLPAKPAGPRKTDPVPPIIHQ